MHVDDAGPRGPRARSSRAERQTGRVAEWTDAVAAALRPTAARWALGPATGAVSAAALVAVGGALTHRLAAVGLAYFGAACAVVFVPWGPYRLRVGALLGQATGAVVGLWLGALPHTPVLQVVVAAAVGFVSGVVGGLGRAATAGGVMAVIGVAFAEFGRVDLGWPAQIGYYLLGTAVVAVVALAWWPWRRDQPERDAVAGVLTASARLFDVAGTSASAPARVALASASAGAHDAVWAGRSPVWLRRPSGELDAAWSVAEQVALAAAVAHAEGVPRPDSAVSARRTAADVQARRPVSAATDGRRPHPRTEFAWRTSIVSGLRLAWCVGIAAAVTTVLHHETHSFWILLTVAVVVRPEYASVFVRTVNRVAGTLAGALLAALFLLVAGHGLPVAAAAAVAIGFAVAGAPKLYALSVVGVTCSTLLSACIGAVDPVYPAVRLLDTVIGAVIAMVFGYLLWPGHADIGASAGLGPAVAVAERYLDAVERRAPVEVERGRAYGAAHHVRAVVGSGEAEPPVVAHTAAAVLPRAIALEDVVDAISALDARSEGAADVVTVQRLRLELSALLRQGRHSG